MQVSYCGDDFAGYQRQPGKRTVQGELDNALSVVFHENIVSYASGRTDAGVHAYGQMVHFDSAEIKKFDKLLYSINSLLPHDVQVVKIVDGGDIHARYTAKRKLYEYKFYISDADNPLLYSRAFRVYGSLDMDKMQKACQLFVGEHDFANFSSVGSTAKTTVRTIYSCRLQENDGIYSLLVEGNGFLYRMVRYIAGAIIKVGQGKLDLDDISSALSGKNLPKNIVLPAHGLYLKSVSYN